METVITIFSAVLILFGITFTYLICAVYRQQLKPLHYDVYLEYIQTNDLGPYYISLTNKLDEKFDKIDEHGGPLVLAVDGKCHYAAIKHAQKALSNYEAYVNTKDISYRDKFLEVVESIIAHGDQGAANSLVYGNTIQSFSNQKVPWLHAMAQGQIIAVLCRAYKETDDQKYLDLAKRAAIPFTRDIADGGVRSIDPIRGVFYEEYAFHEKNKQHHTLNGMMSALMGIHDLWKVSQDLEIKKIFDDGIQTIRNNLMAYDFPFCSSYDLRHEHGELPLFQPRYNSVHVAHLKIMSAFTSDPFFEMVSEKWNQKLQSRFNRICYFVYYLTWKCRDLRNDVSNIGLFKMIWLYRIRITRRLLGRNVSENAKRKDHIGQ